MLPPVDADALVVEEIRFAGAAHRLHGMLTYPQDGDVVGAAVIAGPHPLLGGTLHNNVVCGLADGLARRGLLTLRFDYPGAGGSDGPRLDVAAHLAEFWRTARVPGELAFAGDVRAAADCARSVAGAARPVALVGYSFGCALLPHARRADEPLVLIAPTLARHDYDGYRTLAGAKLVVASEDDFACDAARLRDWFDRLLPPRSLILRRFDNHFFRGHEEWLAATVFDFLAAHRGDCS